MPNQIKVTRTLFVGLGGTGVKAILRAKQCFMDAYGEVPPMVAFLAVDTDKAIRDMSRTSRRGGMVRLSDNEICFCGITGSALDIYNHNLPRFQWLPKRNVQYLSNLKNTGAGQVRSNGRFLARHNADGISKVVASKVTEIGQPIPVGNRFVYATNKDGAEYPVRVNVVGSVAGGTGSGTIIDMLVLISKTLRDSGLAYEITPWLVLPEVFAHMAPGPATASVLQNAYGALCELDYLYHLPKDNQGALDFGFDRVHYLDEGIGDTYLISNTNKAGVVLQNVDDITDTIGRCMFLPSNEVDSVQDNTGNFRFNYGIRDKEAHYVSAGSAEIVYDNQAVGNAVARGIISKICNELVKSASSVQGAVDVNAWMSSASVAIQEHEEDLLIDSILSKYAPFSILIDKESDENTITAYINAGAEADNVKDEAMGNETEKLEGVKHELDEKVNDLLNTQNGIGDALVFLHALSESVALCKGEMCDEAEALKKELAYSVDWASKISALKGSIVGIFKTFNQDAAEALQGEVTEYIARKRDLLRHNWAIQFYTDFQAYVDKIVQRLQVLKATVEKIEKRQGDEIRAIQQRANSTSKFQIFLHSSDVDAFSLPDVAGVSALFRSKHAIPTLVGMNEKALSDLLFDFAKVQQEVVSAVNVTVEEKLAQMSDAERRAIFEKVKEMSSPLWATNTLGYLDHAQQMTTVFTIGVYDQAGGIIQDKYRDEFTMGANKPTFATTHETDRITFFQTQCYSPVYAVNNVPGYMRDAELKSKTSYPVYYLDEMWHQRMEVEKFSVMPRQEEDRVLPNWVAAIVYGFVKYDEERKTYFIESEKGDPLEGGFLPLGERRDLAFEQFRTQGLDAEVEERLNQMIDAQGRPAIEAVMEEVCKDTRNYVAVHAGLSKIELDRVRARDAAYQMVRELLEKEVGCLKPKQ